MKHTKGKWFPRKCTDGEIDIASHLSETMESPSIAIVQPVSSMLAKVGGGTTEANARLIASAPEMLQVLKSLCLVLSDDVNDYPDTQLFRMVQATQASAKVVIGKAEGEI